jgi:VanZ family protein
VTKTRRFFWYLLPIGIWMAVIFSASSDAGSFQHSSRIVAPVVRFLFPRISEEGVHAIVFGVRKVAHLTEYALLAGLVWRAFRSQDIADRLSWSWKHALQTILVVALYAASDELHQAFVPNREASAVDVLIDTAGAAGGLFIIWGVRRFRRTD